MIFDPKTKEHRSANLQDALTYLNEFLVFDGYEIVPHGKSYDVVDKTRGEIVVDVKLEPSHLSHAFIIATVVGVAGALAAAAAGLADWMDIDPPEKAIGAFHATVNISATLLFLISFLMRWRHHWEAGWSPFVVALAGYLLVMIGGYLGGALVFYKGVMVNRNAYRTGPDEFKPVVAMRDLVEAQLTRALVDEQPVLLLKLGGTVYALGSVCSHYGAPLNEGKIAVVQSSVPGMRHDSRLRMAG